ncbi:MAG: DNA polymerase III subunit delta' [Caldimicrobium sp.]|nr:DNA polymerase III subunit delta' [Caldimicrobium sp.]MCX7612638.1 DNA polymerase III subunit delta' [Caldimicrobium sp.]MDW8182209.1 DNA polymerase III subunit delta' [Caldimicrobium sp.]
MQIIRNLSEIIGQEPATKLLKASLHSRRLAHSYLFSGPPGVGKKTTARALLYHLFCHISSDNPCGGCLACKKIERDIHPDIKFLHPEKKDIRIDSIREVERFLRFRPTEGNYRVVIISQAERLNPEAGNALLKSLEEPPLYSLFVLITEKTYQMLPTILSRCQIVRFNPIPTDLIKEHLKRRLLCEESVADSVAEISSGSLGWALEILNSGILEELNSFVKVGHSGSEDGKFRRLEKISKQDRNYLELLLYVLVIWIWRSYLNAKGVFNYPNSFPEEKFTGDPFIAIQELDRAKRAIENFINTELILYTLMKKLFK